MRRAFVLIAAIAGASCGNECKSGDSEGVRVLYGDPSSRLESFVAHPFPSDALRRARGGIDLRHFPNPSESSTLDDYLRVFSESTNGFGTSTPLYLGFSGPIDPGTLPGSPADAMDPDASLMLVDVDPDSPERGRRYPLLARPETAATQYLPENALSLLVPYGIPLAPSTTYALIATDRLKAKSGDPVQAAAAFHNGLRDKCRESASESVWSALAPLRDFLSSDEEIEPDEVVGGTVFTTQESLAELRSLAAAARAEPPPEVRNLEANGYSDGYLAFRAEIDLPAYQAGDVPYQGLEDGGAFARDETGGFMVTHRETTRISVALPRLTRMPEGGWPVVLYAHGTGGDFESALNPAVADVLGRLGVAVVGYDQTLHGPRDPTSSDPRLTFFNLFNPVAARDNIRQGAADATVMTTLIESMVIPASITGRQDERFDPERIAFVGHSQGALTGALFAAVDERPKAFVFSGLGAILSITLQERKDIVDFEALLRSLLDIPEAEPFDDFHPVLGLVETFIEPADPIAYARSYLENPPGGAVRDLLIVEGFLDFASPARGQEAFATAARFPVVSPVHRVPDAAAIVGPEPQDAPAKENVQSKSGAATAGMIQYPEETHYPIFDNEDANRRFAEFVRTALLEGRAVIVP